MPPAGGVMLGASRTVARGSVLEYERLLLQDRDGKLLYVADPSGQTQTEFTESQMSDSSFTVENLSHDFPKRIGYRRVGTDSLVAHIEGPGVSGVRRVDFPMRRVSCRTRHPARSTPD